MLTHHHRRAIRSLIVLVAASALAPALGQVSAPRPGAAAKAGTAGRLQAIYESSKPRARGGARAFSPELLNRLYGVTAGGSNQSIDVVMRVEGPFEPVAKALGISMHVAAGDSIFAKVPLDRVASLMAHEAVISAEPLMVSGLPAPVTPSQRQRGASRSTAPGPFEFDRRGLTGDGVIVAVIDTGIDWRHPDFLHPDGTTRILAYYDMSDDSFERSAGSAGRQPPIDVTTEDGERIVIGTVYSSDDINRALREGGSLGMRPGSQPPDVDGHGTAVAGVAAAADAGNGHVGVAPEANLIVVGFMDGVDTAGNPTAPVTDLAQLYAIDWIVRTAGQLDRPCVINMSYGSGMPPRDANAPTSRAIDAICKADRPGLVVCAAAGNSGRTSLRAEVKFGALGQIDDVSVPVQLASLDDDMVMFRFSEEDDWFLGITDIDGAFGEAGRLYYWFPQLVQDGEEWHRELHGSLSGEENPALLDEFFAHLVEFSSDGGYETVYFTLPKGTYNLYGGGRSEQVRSGRAVFDLSMYPAAFFGSGGINENMIGTPGTSMSAITVGSYSGQSSWAGPDGTSWRLNLDVGAVSDFSSYGFLRNGRPKPDISGPGEILVSSLAAGSRMAKSAGSYLASTGQHLAWQGTSASSPYVAGVVALMLEKNPTLTANQVREILRRTAVVDDETGGVPNVRVGWGKLDPEKALDATPAP